MAKFRLRITQVLRVRRECSVEVEAATMAEAIERQINDDAPAYDDPGWTSHPDLQDEEVVALPQHGAG